MSENTHDPSQPLDPEIERSMRAVLYLLRVDPHDDAVSMRLLRALVLDARATARETPLSAEQCEREASLLLDAARRIRGADRATDIPF